MKILNRRSVLRGVGGAAIALPFLDIMIPARAACAQEAGTISKIGKNGRPKRLRVDETKGSWAAGTWCVAGVSGLARPLAAFTDAKPTRTRAPQRVILSFLRGVGGSGADLGVRTLRVECSGRDGGARGRWLR